MKTPHWIKYWLCRWEIPVTVLMAVWVGNGFFTQYPISINTVGGGNTPALQPGNGRGRTAMLEPCTPETVTPVLRDLFASGEPRAAGVFTAPPVRNLRLSGITGGEAALVIDGAGRSTVVQTGDVVDGARVLKISAGQVTLQDQAGTFEIRIDD